MGHCVSLRQCNRSYISRKILNRLQRVFLNSDMEEKKTGDTGAVHSVHYYYIKQSNIQVGDPGQQREGSVSQWCWCGYFNDIIR